LWVRTLFKRLKLPLASLSMVMLIIAIGCSIRAQFASDWLAVDAVNDADNSWTKRDMWSDRISVCVSYRTLAFDKPGVAAEIAAGWRRSVGSCGTGEPGYSVFRRDFSGRAGFGHEWVRASNARRFTWFTGDTSFFGSERVLMVRVPFWLLMLIFAAGMSPLVRQAYVRRYLVLDPAAKPCPRCGYDLRATPERCPECGRKADGNSQPLMNTDEHR
jgi:hypothetical protein